MRPRTRYFLVFIVGAVLVAHAFLYEGVLTDAQLVSFLDPVGAISPMPYGTYHVGVGIAYGTTATLGGWATKRTMQVRDVLLATGGAFIVSCAGMTTFWWMSPEDLRWWWEGAFVLATAQVTLVPLLGVSVTVDRRRELFGVGSWGLTEVFWTGSILSLFPLFIYGLAGIVGGGWGLLNGVTVAVLLLLNGIFGYPLYRLGQGFWGVGSGHVSSDGDRPTHPS